MMSGADLSIGADSQKLGCKVAKIEQVKNASNLSNVLSIVKGATQPLEV